MAILITFGLTIWTTFVFIIGVTIGFRGDLND